MRVWLKGFNSTFKCPAVINVWKVLWVYMKFCDIKDSALSAFSSFKICVTLSLLLHVSHRHASFTHVNYNSHLTLKMHSNFFFIYIFLSACRLGFISLFYLVLSVWVGLILDGYYIKCVQLTSFVSWKSPLLDMYLFSHGL